MSKSRKMNPLKAHFYTMYLELFLFGNAFDIRRSDNMLGAMDLPPQIRKLAYVAKHQARYCESKAQELKKMYALQFTDGYIVKGDKVLQMLYYEQFDPQRKENALANTRLFASAKDHEAETIIYERG